MADIETLNPNSDYFNNIFNFTNEYAQIQSILSSFNSSSLSVGCEQNSQQNLFPPSMFSLPNQDQQSDFSNLHLSRTFLFSPRESSPSPFPSQTQSQQLDTLTSLVAPISIETLTTSQNHNKNF